jgi:hypothetical protein
MTLGEFRKYSEKLSDDIELVANLGIVREKINTFSLKGKTLELCYSCYGQERLESILRSITILMK